MKDLNANDLIEYHLSRVRAAEIGERRARNREQKNAANECACRREWHHAAIAFLSRLPSESGT